MFIDDMKLLCAAIIDRAIEDYKELKRRGKEWISTVDGGNYSIQELEHFFKSKYCDAILDAYGNDKCGWEILEQLRG